MSRFSFNEADHVYLLDNKRMHGTTTVLEIMGKVLTWWASSLAVKEMGWINPKDEGVTPQERLETAAKRLVEVKSMSPEGYLAFLDKAYRAHSVRLKDTASAGTDLHSAVEEWIRGEMTTAGTLLPDERLTSFIAWSKQNVKRFLASEICTYSERLWVGGKFDFIYEDNGGRIILADVKSAKACYYSQFVQMGSYDICLTESGGYTEKGDKVFTLPKPIDAHAVFLFGGPKGFTAPVLSNGTIRNKRSFESALQLYKDDMDYKEVMGNGKKY